MIEHINAENLAANESFQDWVNNRNPENNSAWENWVNTHPEHKMAIEEARILVKLLITLRKKEVAHKKKELVLQDMKNRLAIEAAKDGIMKPVQATTSHTFGVVRRQWFYRAAAATIVFLAGLALFYNYSTDHLLYTSGFGETKQVILPDGSHVTLNSNSSLQIRRKWGNNQARELWLKGEAFFSVKHTPGHQRFLVYTDNGDVEVLGTTFNVYSRHQKTRVVLETGSLRFFNQSQTVLLKPGEMLEVSKKLVSQPKPVDVTTHTGWKANVLVYRNTSLYDVVKDIEDTYGYNVVWEDERLGELKFTYTVRADERKLLFEALSQALGIQIKLNGNTLTISPNSR